MSRIKDGSSQIGRLFLILTAFSETAVWPFSIWAQTPPDPDVVQSQRRAAQIAEASARASYESMRNSELLQQGILAAIIFGITVAAFFGWQYVRHVKSRDVLEIETRQAELELKRQQAETELKVLQDRLRREEFEAAKSAAESAIITATTSALEGENDGFQYFKTDERHKSLFVDAFNGFREFAELKGYSVSVAIDSGQPGMVGLKVTIIDIGITVSTIQVRRDVNEYINKLNAGDDLTEMPIVTDPAEHAKLVNAIRARNDMLRHQASLNEYAATTYRGMLETLVGNGAFRAISYQPPTPLHIEIRNDGGKLMPSNNTATNSPGAAVGSRNQAGITQSVVSVGRTEGERSAQVNALENLIAQIKASSLNDDSKSEALRNLANVKEEVTEEAPDNGRIEKWLNGAREIVSLGTAGAALAGKVNDVVSMFTSN